MNLQPALDSGEAAHTEPLHLDIHCYPSNLWILNMIDTLDETFVEILQAQILSALFCLRFMGQMKQANQGH